MAPTIVETYKKLYDECSSKSAELSGDLAGMAYLAHELLHIIKLGKLDTVRGQIRVEALQKELHQYYTTRNTMSPLASAYQDDFEAGIVAGMKENV